MSIGTKTQGKSNHESDRSREGFDRYKEYLSLQDLFDCGYMAKIEPITSNLLDTPQGQKTVATMAAAYEIYLVLLYQEFSNETVYRRRPDGGADLVYPKEWVIQHSDFLCELPVERLFDWLEKGSSIVVPRGPLATPGDWKLPFTWNWGRRRLTDDHARNATALCRSSVFSKNECVLIDGSGVEIGRVQEFTPTVVHLAELGTIHKMESVQ